MNETIGKEVMFETYDFNKLNKKNIDHAKHFINKTL